MPRWRSRTQSSAPTSRSATQSRCSRCYTKTQIGRAASRAGASRAAEAAAPQGSPDPSLHVRPRKDPMTVDTRETARRIERAGAVLEGVRKEVGRAVVGQQMMVDRLLVGLLSGGHVLLEGVPGLAKTLAVKSLSDSLSLSFHRIQF